MSQQSCNRWSGPTPPHPPRAQISPSRSCITWRHRDRLNSRRSCGKFFIALNNLPAKFPDKLSRCAEESWCNNYIGAHKQAYAFPPASNDFLKKKNLLCVPHTNLLWWSGNQLSSCSQLDGLTFLLQYFFFLLLQMNTHTVLTKTIYTSPPASRVVCSITSRLYFFSLVNAPLLNKVGRLGAAGGTLLLWNRRIRFRDEY